ncbi:GH17471 [Drosophila grimshawi]|uniref:GH17471 n=1 Tax=Drosophila grimshawi TaxID=7222 RepID=B4JTQ9_DROGR|nr:GH17471 [Drosophila grimshawi]
MIAKAFLLALLVAVASATPVTQDTSMVGYRKAMDMFLDAWKKMIPCGFPSENIPVLAPLTTDFYAFNYNNGETNLVGNVSNIRISGLNNFQVLSGSYDPTTLRATFDVLFPELQILGSYEVEGTVGIGGLPLPIRQSVLINKKLSDWRFVGDYTFAQSLSTSNGLRLADFNLQYFVADPYVNPMLEKYLVPTINNLLSNVDMTQLTNYLAMQAEMWNNAACIAQA